MALQRVRVFAKVHIPLEPTRAVVCIIPAQRSPMIDFILNNSVECDAVSALSGVSGNRPHVIEISRMWAGARGFKAEVPVDVSVLKIETVGRTSSNEANQTATAGTRLDDSHGRLERERIAHVLRPAGNRLLRFVCAVEVASRPARAPLQRDAGRTFEVAPDRGGGVVRPVVLVVDRVELRDETILHVALRSESRRKRGNLRKRRRAHNDNLSFHNRAPFVYKFHQCAICTLIWIFILYYNICRTAGIPLT